MGDNIFLDFLRLAYPIGTEPEKYDMLDNNIKGFIWKMNLNYSYSYQNVIIQCKQINHNYTLELSLRGMGNDVDYENAMVPSFRRFQEPLTLAYI